MVLLNRKLRENQEADGGVKLVELMSSHVGT